MEATYIVTAEMDDSFAWLDSLRRQHFPPKHNFLPAHLTLFHRLSPAQVAVLRSIDVPTIPVHIHFDRVVLLGLGVALHVSPPNSSNCGTRRGPQLVASSNGRTASLGGLM
jgi:hypothetical protein